MSSAPFHFDPAYALPNAACRDRNVPECRWQVPPCGEVPGNRRCGLPNEATSRQGIVSARVSEKDGVASSPIPTAPGLLSEADLKVSVLGPFIAALDTVAGTCSFMLYALLRNPDLLARARAEADTLFADGEPAWSDVGKMDVLHRTALETLRMYPVVPMLARTVTNSFEFAGYRIEAGESVMVATSVPHYLPECFPDPDRFDIERYAEGRAEHRQPYAYAPFGLGPHRCLGNGFAEVQIIVTMATLLHDVELALHPSGYRLKTAEVPLPRPRDSFRVRASAGNADGD